MKNQKGISLIALIVTIIVIVILSAITIKSSFRTTLDDTSFTRKVSEMTEVYDAVVQRALEHQLEEAMYPYKGTALTDNSPRVINGVSYGAGYYYISSAEDKKDLNIERITDDYIVNYSTGEVISVSKILYEGKELYSLSDVVSILQPGSIVTASGEYDEVQNVNKPILSDGMIPVVQEGNKWIVKSSSSSDWYDYSNGKYATIMLLDELTLEDESNAEIVSNEELRKKTRAQLEELDGYKVVVQGSTFIWIPRYTYKIQSGNVDNVDIVYSHLTQDYVQDGYVKNPAFYFGEYKGANTSIDVNSGYVGGGKELTGIWISKYEAGFNN